MWKVGGIEIELAISRQSFFCRRTQKFVQNRYLFTLWVVTRKRKEILRKVIQDERASIHGGNVLWPKPAGSLDSLDSIPSPDNYNNYPFWYWYCFCPEVSKHLHKIGRSGLSSTSGAHQSWSRNCGWIYWWHILKRRSSLIILFNSYLTST